MAIDNKHKILIGLALILAALLTYRAVNPFRQQSVPKLTYGRTNRIITPQAKHANGNASDRLTRIKTDLLAPPPQLDLKVSRDPFRRPPKAAASRAPKPKDQKTAPKIATPEERAREALVRFKAFGSFRQGDQEALFLQRGQQVLIVNVGDRIDGKFKIEAIDGRTVVVSTSEVMTAPFQFEFEELQPAGIPSGGRTSVARPRQLPVQRPVLEDEFEPPPLESNDSSTYENDEDLSPPSLPEPPPLEKPALPPTSKGSPSRDYLPGNPPPE